MKKSEIIVMPEYFDRYINLVEDIDVIKALEKNGIETIQQEMNRFKNIGDKIYAPEKWTIKDIIQHLIDTERIFTYRALRFARNDKISLSGYDENFYAANAKASARSFDDLINEFMAVREATLLLYKSFNKEQMSAVGVCFNKSTSVLAIGFVLAGHFIHHLDVIATKYYPLEGA